MKVGYIQPFVLESQKSVTQIEHMPHFVMHDIVEILLTFIKYGIVKFNTERFIRHYHLIALMGLPVHCSEPGERGGRNS